MILHKTKIRFLKNVQDRSVQLQEYFLFTILYIFIYLFMYFSIGGWRLWAVNGI